MINYKSYSSRAKGDRRLAAILIIEIRSDADCHKLLSIMDRGFFIGSGQFAGAETDFSLKILDAIRLDSRYSAESGEIGVTVSVISRIGLQSLEVGRAAWIFPELVPMMVSQHSDLI